MTKKTKFARPELGNPPAVKIETRLLDKLKVHWMIKENHWRPLVRIGATFTVCGNKVFLFGGYNKTALNDL